MRYLMLQMVASAIFLVSDLAHGASGLTSAQTIGTYLNGAFSNVPPGSGSGWTQRDYFPSVKFVEPIRIVEHPSQNKLIVVSKDGRGYSITNSEGATDKTLYFDIRSIMHGNPSFGESGISDLVFHPEFDTNTSNSAYVYISYWYSPDYSGTFSEAADDGYNRLSRFEVIGDTVALSTEQVLISQYDRDKYHIAMDLQFGPDGFLYITMGDESNGASGCCNITTSTQSLTGGLWSGVLRIDVDNDSSKSHAIRRQPTHPVASPQANGGHWPNSYTQNYSIPNDNPFLDTNGALLEEFYSFGLRHPWTMSIDSLTGEVWVADVGHQTREEINLIMSGGNYQWPYKEGTQAGIRPNHKLSMGVEKPPIFEYASSVGESPIGAGIYRGPLFPELYGKYIFTDFLSGKLWTATKSGPNYNVEQIGNVTAGWGNGINSHLIHSSGQILMAKSAGPQNGNGAIHILDRVTNTTNEPPTLLSQVGAFAELSSLTPASGCISYSLNVPFWSDAAAKYRWVCIPNDGDHNTAAEKIQYSDEGIWQFPIGTVFIKHFEMAVDTTNPGNTFPLETRFLVHSDDGYYGITYRWNAAGTDAILDPGSGSSREFTQITSSGIINRSWSYPSRTECLVCHTQLAGSVLGASTRQLNRDHFYPSSGVTGNQLESYNSIGLFSPGIDPASVISSVLTSTPTNNTAALIEDRARSYLDSNCGYCHQPTGVRATFDARLTTPLANQGIIDGELLDNYGIPGEAVVVPGSPSQSLAYHRANQIGDLAMPPLSKTVLDTIGLAVIESWILSLDPNTHSNGICNGLPVTVYLAVGDTPTSNADVILGTEGSDTIVAMGGDDTICALGGIDMINGGRGEDWIDGGEGADDILGAADNDTIFGGLGNDLLQGGPGDDDIFGDGDDDTILGNSGADTIHGGSGVDAIKGGSGADTIQTGSGSTVGTGKIVDGGSGNDIINGGPDEDEIRGSTNNDIIMGGGGNDRLFGGGGADDIEGEGGDDFIRGNAANDTIDGGDGRDDIDGGSGKDVVFGGPDNDTLKGSTGNDEIHGDGGDDDIRGGGGNDVLFGEADNDTILGGGSNDDMDGGSGTDDSCDGEGGIDTATACETVSGIP